MEDQVRAVRVMQDYIRKHIDEEISIEDVASEASFSSSHARRLFIKYVGMTPAVYISRFQSAKTFLKSRTFII